MSKVDWSLAPEGATHYCDGAMSGFWRDLSERTWKFYRDSDRTWHDSGDKVSSLLHNGCGLKLIQRPQPKPWSGQEDGLPPVGLEVEIKIDFKKAPPYAIITLTELGVDVQNHTPRFQKVKVLYASSKYLVAESCGSECLTPMSCVEIRAIRKPEQLAAELRDTAIRELMDIAQVDCRVTAARLVDAGFKREVV